MELKEILERMHNKKLYYSADESLVKEQLNYLDLLFEFNHLKPSKQKEKMDLLKKMFAEIGEDCYIETPFNANWGGKNVHFGNGIYANFNLTIIDDTHIYVGNNVMFGPNVVLSGGSHPVSPELRKKAAQFNDTITICDNVWLGANVCVMPGITIGENSIIGAGAVVTKDIPENVIAVGNPCKVLREINENDRKYYHKDLIIDIE